MICTPRAITFSHEPFLLDLLIIIVLMYSLRNFLTLPGLLLCFLACCQNAAAHGGVSLEDDTCKLRIGFLEAHFAVYQPLSSGSREFCEDIPDVTKSVFVIDYLHDFLKEMSVDFRIIKDTNDLGIYARWDDIVGLEDIENDTVFYQPPVKRPDGVLTVNYDFQQAGGYIGIVSARHPDKEKSYNAVFYFQVGGKNYGYLPLFILLVILAQAFYWFSNRQFTFSTK